MPSQDWIEANRAEWKSRGQKRPPFALAPHPGQESVWDYPRPPRLSPDFREVVVRLGSVEIARSSRTIRVLETASPPTFYIPPDDMSAIERAAGGSLCEWKGQAAYWTVTVPGQRLERVGWSYPEPFPGFEAIRDYFAFYPAQLECCGWHPRSPPAGPVLWRLGDTRACGTFQRRARIGNVVAPRRWALPPRRPKKWAHPLKAGLARGSGSLRWLSSTETQQSAMPSPTVDDTWVGS